ncbi:MAG: hypothetical protein WCO63_09690 [Bacteroidota bacterium]
MERRKYTASFDDMQTFALKNSELDKIKGGDFWDDLEDWFHTTFGGGSSYHPGDGNVGHGGGPK